MESLWNKALHTREQCMQGNKVTRIHTYMIDNSIMRAYREDCAKKTKNIILYYTYFTYL